MENTPPSLSRRRVLKFAAAGLPAAAIGTPLFAQDKTITVSLWGGPNQEFVQSFVEPEFQKSTGAKVIYDIGGQGARYNKLKAQRSRPNVDVFFSTEEGVVAGLKEGIIAPVTRSKLKNAPDLYDWALTVPAPAAGTLACVPYTVMSYEFGYHRDKVANKPASWLDLMRPDYAGKLAFVAPVQSMTPALLMLYDSLGGGPGGGFAAFARMKPRKLTVFWTDWAPLLQTGDVLVATDFDCYLLHMQKQGYPIVPVTPTEGGVAAVLAGCVVNGSANVELAHAFMDVMIAKRTQEACAAATFQSPVVKSASLPADLAAQLTTGEKVKKLRFFSPEKVFENRAAWTEKLNTEIVPAWGAR